MGSRINPAKRQVTSWHLFRHLFHDSVKMDSGMLAVMAVLARYHNYLDDFARPSVPTIAKKAGMTKQGVHKILNRSEEAGLIRRDTTPGQVTHYTLFPGTRFNAKGKPLNQDEGLEGAEPLNVVRHTPKRGRLTPKRRSDEQYLTSIEQKDTPLPPLARGERPPRASPVFLTALNRATAAGHGKALDSAATEREQKQLLADLGFYSGPIPEPMGAGTTTIDFAAAWLRKRLPGYPVDPSTPETWAEGIASEPTLATWLSKIDLDALERLRLEALEREQCGG